MNAKELFGVAVRTIGLWLIANGAISMTAVLAAPEAMIGIAVYLVVGAILFFRAEGFVRTAYGSSDAVRRAL